MPAVTVRNIPEETHRAIKQRAKMHGVSAEAEIRNILEEAVRPAERVKLGTLLYELGQRFGGVELDITRDPTPTDAPDFE
jgi:plasmid stability protein